MQYVIGFMIALFIALTGVGAGTITVPVLVLFLGVPAADAVAIGLAFTTAVKSIMVPTQIMRRTIAWRTLGLMLLGGAPGVLLGSLFLRHLVTAGAQNQLNAILGAILVTTAVSQILFSFRAVQAHAERKDRSNWLSWLMLPVGAEVGFSSAGAGALGSAALLSLTPLEPAQVVGTDITFGFVLSLLGSSAHRFAGASHVQLLVQLIAGGAVGAITGVMVSTRVPRRPLRLALWICLLFLGGQFLFNSFQVHRVEAKAVALQGAREQGSKGAGTEGQRDKGTEKTKTTTGLSAAPLAKNASGSAQDDTR